MIKKADIFLFIFLIILGGALSYFSIAGSVTGSKVLVTLDGEVYGMYSLSENRVISVDQGASNQRTGSEHLNKITIKDGKVSMTFSDCHNQVCVKHSEISRTSESIVCLPNKVMVEIIAGDGANDKYDNNEGGDFDAISN